MAVGVLHGGDAAVQGVSIDSRTLRAGELFIALRGESFDGHDFVTASGERGAIGAMVERKIDVSLPQILVDDVFVGMANLAQSWRRRCRLMMIALTGSNGKTTVKKMLTSILRRRWSVLATHGNLNNHIGVPLTLLALREEHEVGVLELGANHPGEIARLAAWVQPEVGLVLNAGPAHLEGFGSIEGVAHAKGELFECLPKDGIGIVNADDNYCDYWRRVLQPRRTISFGIDHLCDVSGRGGAEDAEISIAGETRHLHLAIPGRHNLRNALAAAAVAHSLNVDFEDIIAGLEAIRAVPGRLSLLTGVCGVRLIDDTYNANPASLAAALEVLAECRGERWFVLGDMAELGTEALELHAEAGRSAARQGVARLFALGALSRAAADAFGAGGECFESCEALIKRLRSQLPAVESLSILIKGSRSARMERVVQALMPPCQGAASC